MTPGKSWQARLERAFRQAGSRTVLAASPAPSGRWWCSVPSIRRAPICHVYLVHPPGGIVGGDAVDAAGACAKPQAHALITTPAATTFLSCRSASARHAARRTSARAPVRWNGCRRKPSCSRARGRAAPRGVELAGEARFLGWEITCLGRPANGEGFARRRAAAGFPPVHAMASRCCWTACASRGGSAALAPRWGLAGAQAMGTLLMYPARELDLATLPRTRRVAIARHAMSVVDEVLVCRALAAQAEAVRHRCSPPCGCKLRESLHGRAAVAPRIWAT